MGKEDMRERSVQFRCCREMGAGGLPRVCIGEKKKTKRTNIDAPGKGKSMTHASPFERAVGRGRSKIFTGEAHGDEVRIFQKASPASAETLSLGGGPRRKAWEASHRVVLQFQRGKSFKGEQWSVIIRARARSR